MKRLLLIPIVLLISGCNSKTDQKEKLAFIQPENTFFSINIPESMKKEREVQLSEIADTIEYISLETSQRSLLGSIMDVKMSKDFIFINSWKGPLTQFDKSGKFIRSIGRIGRGPEEYIMIREFSIDEGHRKIYIQSNYNRSMQVYSFDGDHLESIIFPEDYGKIVWSRDSLLMCFNEPTRGVEKNIFEEINSKGEILQSVKNMFFWQNNNSMSYLSNYPQRKVYYRLDNRLHFKDWYNDTVYTYDSNEKIIPKYLIDLGSSKLPDLLRTEVTGTSVKSPEFYWASANESVRYIFIVYSSYSSPNDRPGGPTDFGFIYFDKKNMEATRYNRNRFLNDLDGGPNFYPEYVNDSTAFGFEPASQLKRYLETDNQENASPKKLEMKKILRTRFKGLDESDNPIIMLVRLKS
jgi:hypothetical protein